MEFVSKFEKSLKTLIRKNYPGFKEFFYKGLGYEQTPLEEVEGIHFKREDYLGEGGLKNRAFVGAFYLMKEMFENKQIINIASSGNYLRAGAEVLERLDSQMNIESYILKGRIDRDPQLKKFIEEHPKLDVTITPEEGICPMTGRKGGRTIANALTDAKENPASVFVDQHGDSDNTGRFANILGQLTLGEELAKELEEAMILTHGLGTCVSSLGMIYGYETVTGEKPDFIGLLPQTSRQIGLRNRESQGRSENFKIVENLAEEIKNISDKEAYLAMEELWEKGIPAGITTGTNYSAAKEIKKYYKKPVVTLMPDATGNYRNYFQSEDFRRHYKKIMKKKFPEELYESLKYSSR